MLKLCVCVCVCVDSGETRFCVANTHLLFNPKAGEVKLAQVAYLFAELHKMASNSGLCSGLFSIKYFHICLVLCN